MGVRRCVSAWVLQTTTMKQMRWKTKNEHTRDGGKSILTPTRNMKYKGVKYEGQKSKGKTQKWKIIKGPESLF